MAQPFPLARSEKPSMAVGETYGNGVHPILPEGPTPLPLTTYVFHRIQSLPPPNSDSAPRNWRLTAGPDPPMLPRAAADTRRRDRENATGAEVIYPKDLGAILVAADLFPGGACPRSRRRLGGAVDDGLARRLSRHRLRAAGGLRPACPGERRGTARRRRALRRRRARRLRGHRRDRARPRAPRSARTLACRRARRAGARSRWHPRRLPAFDHANRRAAASPPAVPSPSPRRSRSCGARGTSRGGPRRPDHRMVADCFVTAVRRVLRAFFANPNGESD